ncbi:MAG TPA: hypothetical protein VFE24_05545 [Pirellulales bacterium]|jgi:hypothetical protein|nr:hypothetical protein [Pirellulales bacterium]
MSATMYEQLASEVQQGRTREALAALADSLRGEKRYHDLFDVRLMQARERLGLPIVQGSKLDDLPEPVRSQIEEAYLEACREIGRALLAQNQFREAWMYLRPADARSEMKQALEDCAVDEENVDEIVELALNEGLHPRRGFELLLNHFGTCNAITTFESQLARFPLADQQAAAALLIRNLRQELDGALRAEIQHQEGAPPPEKDLAGLVQDRDWLFLNGNYHVDTTHLAAIVRFARLCNNPDDLRAAIDLTAYGHQLDAQFQFVGDEPFVEIYPRHRLFFRTLLGEDVEAGVAYFRERAENVAVGEHGTQAIEFYIALLARLGRHQEALEAAQKMLAPGTRRLGIAPSAMELARAAHDYRGLLQNCREAGDLVGYVHGLLAAQEK